MAFQDIPPVETADVYIERALTAGTDKANQTRVKKLSKDRTKRSRIIEVERLTAVADSFLRALTKIVNKFPNMEDFTPFYEELAKLTLDYGKVKKSLGAVQWGIRKITFLQHKHMATLKRVETIYGMNTARHECIGRMCSIIKQIKQELVFVEEARKVLRGFPTIKTMPTVCICGFPNVGKSTLLSKISTAKPEIQEYAFTTKHLNLGYIAKSGTKVQLIDTPGTLARFEKMNDVEKQAYLAIKHCGDKLVYVYDLTESYSLKKQDKLFEELAELGRDMIVYLSKTDIVDKKVVEAWKEAWKREGKQEKVPVFTDREALKHALFSTEHIDRPRVALKKKKSKIKRLRKEVKERK